MARGTIIYKIFNSGPLILLYYLCISEIDTNLEKVFEIFTLNFHKYPRSYVLTQLPLIYNYSTRYGGAKAYPSTL